MIAVLVNDRGKKLNGTHLALSIEQSGTFAMRLNILYSFDQFIVKVITMANRLTHTE